MEGSLPPVQFELYDLGIEMQDSSNFEIPDFLIPDPRFPIPKSLTSRSMSQFPELPGARGSIPTQNVCDIEMAIPARRLLYFLGLMNQPLNSLCVNSEPSRHP